MKSPLSCCLVAVTFLTLSPRAFTAEDFAVHNNSFEDPTSTESKIENWKLVPDPQQGNWDRWSEYTGDLIATDGTWLLYANSSPAVAVQLLREHPITPGSYVFSMDAGTQGRDAAVLPRGVQLAIYAIPTDAEEESRFTLLAEKTLSAVDLQNKGDWSRLEVKVEIPEGSPHIGHFFQMNITSAPAAEQPDPTAPMPAQVVVDNVIAQRE